MKKQRRGKFTYIPKDEIAEVTTFNDVTFENDDLLDGAYVKGRKKYARGGVMKEMSLEQQAAFAVGNDVWFSLPDIEKAELVEELVKSGMITPTSSETDVRIMELIEQDTYADGGQLSDRRSIVLRIAEMMRNEFGYVKNTEADYGYEIVEDFDELESGDFDKFTISDGNDELIIENGKEYIIFNRKKYYNKDLFKSGDKYYFAGIYNRIYDFQPNGDEGALWGWSKDNDGFHGIGTDGLNPDLFIYMFDSKKDYEYKYKHTDEESIIGTGSYFFRREMMKGKYADGGMMAEWAVTITSEDGDSYDWVGFAKNEDEALYEAEKEAGFESVESGVNMITDENGEKIEYADGGYTNKFASMKGGISYFSVDIDTEDGENVRDLEFKSYEKAKKVYDKYKKSMEYDGQAIEDIQLIVNYKNGDYDSIGDSEMMADGGTTKLRRGGFTVGRWYRDSSGEEFKYVGEDMKGNTLFNDGVKTLKKPIEDFDTNVKEEKLFGWFAKGGVATEGKFLVKYYLKEYPNEFKEKFFDDRDKAEFFFETIQDDDDIVVMPIEEMRKRKSSVPAMSTTVYDKVIAEKAAEKSAPKSLFAAAKPVPVTKTAAKKRERVEVDGISELIRQYDEYNAIIKDAESQKSSIGGELKEIGREKFLDLYEQRGFRPANFDLADGNENILLEVTDKYLKVEPEKAAMLEQFDGLLEVKTTYEFNAEVLEKRVSDSMTVGDVVSMLIQDSNLLSDSDKENLIKAKTTMRVPKGTIDRLLDYDNPREVFNLISPILALK